MENALNKLFSIIFILSITKKLLGNANETNNTKIYDEEEVKY
jgi:hypothetical protein